MDLRYKLDRLLIGSRMLFRGNLMRQPAFVQLREDTPEELCVIRMMAGSDKIMNNTLFLFTCSGLTKKMHSWGLTFFGVLVVPQSL
jgi:CDP-6-deoxy-D-xylo-4-hexulose-3-dehydrase